MTAPEAHVVIHGENVDDRLARETAATIRSFLSAVRKRPLKIEFETSDPLKPKWPMRYGNGVQSATAKTVAGEMDVSFRSDAQGDRYQRTIRMPILTTTTDSLEDGPDIALEHLDVFRRLCLVHGTRLEDIEKDDESLLADQIGIELVQACEEAAHRSLCVMKTEGLNASEVVIAPPILDEPMRMTCRNGTIVPEHLRDAISSGMPTAAVIERIGQTGLLLKRLRHRAKAETPGIVEAMRTLHAMKKEQGRQ
jgi:hypothetical protein